MTIRSRISTLPVLIGLIFLCSRTASAQRAGYSHVTALEGSASVISDANGRVDARLNLPLATGDQLTTQEGARVEIELADGNRVQVAGETHIRLDALAAESGSDAAESVVNLLDGDIAAESVASDDTHAFRIDTDDVSVYMPQQAMARINFDRGRGTSVIARQGSVQIQTRTGSRSLEAGEYLLVRGEQEPEVARGSFSRDRFDIWVADRTDSILQAYNSTVSRYVDQDYSADAANLDDYGDWEYSPTYQTSVWRPTVADDWSPYADGDWYYTPAGTSWVSNEPWGWFPYHYGNWFFEAGLGGWCWLPAYVYSPAWVYWCYTPSYVGWCPIGYYSYYGPYGNYWGFGAARAGLYVSVGGIFDASRVDFRRGWSFVGLDRFGQRMTRAEILNGSRMAGRLGSRIAITSDPLRPSLKSGVASASAAMRSYIRTAPEVIARRSSASAAAALTPYLARQKSLPQPTVDLLKTSRLAKVDAVRHTLTGSGASALPASAAPQPTRRGERQLAGGFGKADSWRAASVVPRNSAGRITSDWRARSFSLRNQPESRSAGPAAPRASREPGWRSFTPEARGPVNPGRPKEPLAGRRTFTAPRGGVTPAPEGWRSRPDAPPAQRVIEGIDRGRAVAPPRPERRFQERPASPRPEVSRPNPPAMREYREPRNTPRYESPRPSPPAMREYSEPRSAPRFESPRATPESPRSTAPSRPEPRLSSPPPSSSPSRESSRGRDHRF